MLGLRRGQRKANWAPVWYAFFGRRAAPHRCALTAKTRLRCVMTAAPNMHHILMQADLGLMVGRRPDVRDSPTGQPTEPPIPPACAKAT